MLADVEPNPRAMRIVAILVKITSSESAGSLPVRDFSTLLTHATPHAPP
jgi:hypothetical protein